MNIWIIGIALALAGYTAAVPMVIQKSFSDGHVAPLHMSESESLQDAYIVMLKDDLEEDRFEQHTKWVNTTITVPFDERVIWLNNRPYFGITHVFRLPGLKGYAGKFDQSMLQAIRNSGDVAYVEKDSIVFASEMERAAPWGLARISHRRPLRLTSFDKYQYHSATQDSIKVYVIDTGININHADFQGRASWGITIPSGETDQDENGHGSHCAGIIAGKRYGVAKNAIPIAIKVLRANGSGFMSDVLRGIDWATEQHLQDINRAQKKGQQHKNSVANMSLGGGKSPSLDAFVNKAVDAGITFTVAAGNDNDDACNVSPARAENAITVGASTITDQRAYFSNHGSCVDVFAPGHNIESAWIGSNSATNVISGTSMASPHVAGLAAYFMSLEEHPSSPKFIKDKILSLSTRNVLAKIPKHTPNLLVYNGVDNQQKLPMLS